MRWGNPLVGVTIKANTEEVWSLECGYSNPTHILWRKKMEDYNDGLHYQLDKIESKGKLFNAIITPRSCGKTFAVKRRMVKLGLEGKKFVYLRRRSKELENKKLEDFFKKMQKKGYYSERNLSYKNGIFYCDEKVIGTATALSTGVNERSVDFVDVTDIYFEEFVLKEDANHKYLPDEVFLFLELYSTIARDDDVRVWFLGNKIHEFNPYFLYFDIIPLEKGIKVWKDFAVETWNSKELQEQHKQTRFGKLIADTPYGKYAIENDSYENKVAFIKPLPKKSKVLLNFLYERANYTLWFNTDNTFHLTKYVNNGKEVVAINDLECTPDNKSLKAFKCSLLGNMYRDKLIQNKIYYDSTKTEEVGRAINRYIYF